MTSSLARQLAQGASLNVNLLVDRSRRKPKQSYLFTQREAEHHDLDSIYALGVNGFFRLKSVEPALAPYEDALFSPAAKATDRTLQPAEFNKNLDTKLASFLSLLGPYLLDAPTGKVVEWLVRRFRINEFNVEPVLSLFLPYQESPHFTKMLSILHISESSPFAPLLPYKATSTSLTATALVTVMHHQSNDDLARFVAHILPSTLKEQSVAGVHRALVAFHTGVLLEFVKRAYDKGTGIVLNEGTVTWVLAAAMEPLQLCAELDVETSRESVIVDVILSSYLLLSALSLTCSLSSNALSAILKAVTSCAKKVSPKHIIRTLASICAGQEVANVSLSKYITKVVMKLKGVEEELAEVLAYAGTEKFVAPFTMALTKRFDEERAFDIVNTLITNPQLPRTMVFPIALTIISQLTSSIGDTMDSEQDVIRARGRSILVHIQQRFPIPLQKAFEEALNQESLDDKGKANLEQLLLSLSVELPLSISSASALDNGGNAEGGLDLMLASTSADSAVRAIAVRELYVHFTSEEYALSDKVSVRSALLARVQDTAVVVLEALYSNPNAFLSLIPDATDARTYVDVVCRALHEGTSPSKAIVRAHLSFIANHIWPRLSQDARTGSTASNTVLREIFDRLFFPFLLYSKARQKTAAIVWELIESGEKKGGEHALGRYEVLGGCVDAIRWEEAQAGKKNQGEEGYHNVGVMCRVNLAIAGKMAERIASVQLFEEHFANLLEKLQDSNAQSRALAYLVCRALIAHLSGSRMQQLQCAHRILGAMGLRSLEDMEDFMRGGNDLQTFLHDASLGTAVVLKPSKRETLHRLQAAILVMLPTIPRPNQGTLDWLVRVEAQNVIEESVETTRYVSLQRTLYALANSTASLPILSTHLIRMQLATLGEEALTFLSGTWLNSVNFDNGASLTEYVALRHAAAFFEAHFSSQQFVDFQTVIPSILVALTNSDRHIREAALDSVVALARLAQAKKPFGIYAFDTIYGAASVDLQYLDWGDFCRYVLALQSVREHLVNDGEYLRVWHQQELAGVKGESKKEAGYKQRVLCYLLSHVRACNLPSVKLSLLRTIQEISSPLKAQILLPFIEQLIDDKKSSLIANQLGDTYEPLVSLVVGTLDQTAAGSLNDSNGVVWMVYMGVWKHFFSSHIVRAVRVALIHQLQSGLFAKLKLEQKIELCQFILQTSHPDTDIATEGRNLLNALVSDSQLIIQLLIKSQPSSDDPNQRAVKRAKLDSSATADIYSSLTLLLEILAAKELPGSLELVSCLLDTLSKVVHDNSAAASEKSYVEQLLMSALESCATSIPTDVTLPSNSVRLDILVELIRVVDNPQTSHQALLLMACLARLTPDAVLRNVMPVFTFMGLNVFHRDDTYSFRVVQKTIESIVPVAVSNFKELHSDPFDLYLASRSFLHIFTDAATHIPRHRRNNFFVHLTEVLGQDQFLAPVCLLLVDKMANRVVRQNTQDSANTLALPLSTFRHASTETQLRSLIEMLHEAQRLIGGASQTFLESPADNEAASTHVGRKAHAITIFVGHALKQLASDKSVKATVKREPISRLLSVLLDMAVLQGASSLSDVANAARIDVVDALGIMSATDFLGGVLTAIESGVATVQQGALEVLSEQLANITDKVRQDSKAIVVKIIEVTKKLITHQTPDILLHAAYHALNTIVSTVSAGEEYALTGAVPLVLSSVQERKAVDSSLTTLLSLVNKLGPRIIPYFKDIVSGCVGLLRDDVEDSDSSTLAIGTLRALLLSIPNFWSSKDVLQTIHLYLDTRASASPARLEKLSGLIKVVSKKAPSKVLLTTLCDLWPSLASNNEEVKLLAYFTVLKRAIHAADKTVVSEQLRSLFKTFLDVFDLASTSTFKSLMAGATIPAFLELVLKLNEISFRPLFRKLFDWAFNGESGHAAESRKITFGYVYIALLDHFKGLMTSYMYLLLQPFIEQLNTVSELADRSELWTTIITTLKKTFVYDEGAFWRDDKLRQLLNPLISQVQAAVRFGTTEAKSELSECLVAITEVINDDTLLKSLNLDLLMHTRSEESRHRVYALTCAEAIWQAHGGKLVGFAPETATFIAECAEDENDSVVQAVHRLKNAVESVAGKID